MLKNGQMYFKILAVFILQDIYRMFGYFSILYMKQLKWFIFCLCMIAFIQIIFASRKANLMLKSLMIML